MTLAVVEKMFYKLGKNVKLLRLDLKSGAMTWDLWIYWTWYTSAKKTFIFKTASYGIREIKVIVSNRKKKKKMIEMYNNKSI